MKRRSILASLTLIPLSCLQTPFQPENWRFPSETPAWDVLKDIFDATVGYVDQEDVIRVECSNTFLLQLRVDKSTLLQDADDKFRGVEVIAIPGYGDSVTIMFRGKKGSKSKGYNFPLWNFKDIKGYEKLLRGETTTSKR